MKRTLLIVSIALLFSIKGFSQARVGIKAAGNFSKMAINQEPNTDAIFGPNLGIVVYSNTDKLVFLQSGLLYSTKGSKVNLKNDYLDLGEISYRINFLELPINVGVNIPLGQNLKISPYAGAYGGYALNGKFKWGDISADMYKNESEEDILQANRLDYGANLGVGVVFGNRVILSGQYSHGLANLSDSDNSKVNTRAISAGLTFLF